MACKYQYNNQWYSKEELVNKLSQENSNFKTLYQNLVNEITNTETGRKVFDRIKRDYVYKSNKYEIVETEEWGTKYYEIVKKGQKASVYLNDNTYTNRDEAIKALNDLSEKYTLEEQQEEALVELLGLYTAGRLDKVKDSKLISLLRRLLKEIKAFMRSVMRQKEVEIDKLPDNMTLGDIADLLAYRNSKLILPGFEVVYTTPDNQEFKTYAEVSNHISELAKGDEDIDLSNVNITINDDIPDSFTVQIGQDVLEEEIDYKKINNKWYKITYDYDNGEINTHKKEITFEEAKKAYFTSDRYIGGSQSYTPGTKTLQGFMEKDKEYAQSREIIEVYKKVNNIHYNPEEVYSRGNEFYHVHIAYSRDTLDTELWIQNLLDVIENKKKLNASVELSFATAPVGEVGKGLQYHNKNSNQAVYIVAYPKSEDIKFASQIDNHTSSFTDLTPDLIKVFTNRKNEEVGIAFTKSVPLRNINTIQPNLATIVDDVAHHNEVVIGLTPQNFRIKYQEDVPYRLKKLIDNFNSILDEKYGKLEKPEIKKVNHKFQIKYGVKTEIFDTLEEAEKRKYELWNNYDQETVIKKIQGIQPTQTNETLKESILSIQQRLDNRNDLIPDKFVTKGKHKGYAKDTWFYKKDGEWYIKYVPFDAPFETEVESHDIQKMSEARLGIDEVWESYLSTNPEGIEDLQVKEKEYTEQALINIKAAALKEVAKKYPRSLIRSEVRPINGYSNLGFSNDEIVFQNVTIAEKLNIDNTMPIFENPNEFSDEFMNHC